MQCRDVAQVIEQNGFSPLPEAARGHVAGCAACSSLIADFEIIVSAANQIPSEVEPPARVWVALRAQLEAENIIKEPRLAAPAQNAPWWQGFGQLIRGRMLATAAVALLVAAAGYVQMSRKPATSPVADTAGVVAEPRVVSEPFAAAGNSLDQEEKSLGAIQAASLSEASPVDNSLRENLATLNTFIKECRKRLQEDPHDQVARDYLSAAYQQKAEILAAMMERGRSVN
jgi:hypothetical protein